MKTLILMRHGQVQCISAQNPDGFEIILKDIAKQEIAQVAENLKSDYKVEEIMHSPLVRTQQTAEIIAGITGAKSVFKSDMLTDDKDLMDALTFIDPRAKTALFVTHEPDIDKMVEAVCSRDAQSDIIRSKHDDHYFTHRSAIVLKFNVNNWEDIRPGVECEMEKVYYLDQPKKNQTLMSKFRENMGDILNRPSNPPIVAHRPIKASASLKF